MDLDAIKALKKLDPIFRKQEEAHRKMMEQKEAAKIAAARTIKFDQNDSMDDIHMSKAANLDAINRVAGEMGRDLTEDRSIDSITAPDHLKGSDGGGGDTARFNKTQQAESPQL